MYLKAAFFFAGLCLTMIVVSCSKQDFTGKPKAKDLFHVKNGDYLIPVAGKGNTASKKILLYIQGGPGINSLDFANIDYAGWGNTLEKEYALSYCYQTGTGNVQGNFTQGENVFFYPQRLSNLAFYFT